MKKKLTFATFALFTGLAANAQSFEPEWVGEVAILNITKDTLSMQTEKRTARVEEEISAAKILLGFGSTRSLIVLDGSNSTVQITKDSNIALVVKCKDNESDPISFIQIIKFEEEEKTRESEIGMVDVFDNVSQGNMDIVPFTAEKYGKSSYMLKATFEEGEYGVRVLNPNVVDEKITVFYCFGVHEEIHNQNP